MKPLDSESSPGPFESSANRKRIDGGFILLARKVTKNSIMEKPALYIKLWVWMLLQASYMDHGNLKRGQFFTSLEKMQNAMAYKVGYRTERPTVKEIRSAYDFLTKGNMIGTTKVTHGLLITIVNYDFYQDWKNYEGHSEGHDEGTSRGTIYKKEGSKEGDKKPLRDFSSKISLLKQRYPDQDLIHQAFEAMASIRRTNRIADSVRLSILQSWERYPVEQVEAALRVYLQKGYAGQGKKEAYLLGIIRNNHHNPIGQNHEGSTFKSTGSALFDEAMRNPEKWRPVDQ